MWKIVFISLFIVCLTSCSSQNIEQYKSLSPQFSLQSFFEGELIAKGIVKNRQGELLRRFKADIHASWQGNELTLDEQFEFDDGEKTQRIWKITDLGNGAFSGTAGDVIGQAVGQSSGPVLKWNYQLLIPYNGREIAVTLDDWMYLLDENTLINTTKMSKFGIDVGDIMLVITKK